MSAADRTAGHDAEEPLLAPLPGPDFEALDRRQSVIAWCVGLAAGTLVAAATIVAIVVGVI